MVFEAFEGMKRTGSKEKNIPGICDVGSSSGLDDASPFFYKNQFHAGMPVKRNGKKISGNRAWIDIERKAISAMLAEFL